MKPIRTLLTATALAGSGLLAYAWTGERPRMTLQPYLVRWAPAAGLKILHLSDQHFGREDWIQRRRLDKTLGMVARMRPDLILLTGDFLHDDAGLVMVEKLLLGLPPARLGVYAVLGNHDYAVYSYGELFRNMAEQVHAAASPQRKLEALVQETGQLARLAWNIYRNERLRFAAIPNDVAELRRLLAIYGVTLLDNRAMPLPGRPELWIAGVDDLVEGAPRLEETLASVPDDADVILLTHNPDLAFAPEAARAGLIFSGHTHGGQVVLPRLGAIHTQGTRLPRSQPAGYFGHLPGGGQMIVSRGMGESTPFRFRCPPEVVWVEVV